jgi:hypothetical protein
MTFRDLIGQGGDAAGWRLTEDRPGPLSALHINGVKNKKINAIAPNSCSAHEVVLTLRPRSVGKTAFIVNKKMP